MRQSRVNLLAGGATPEASSAYTEEALLTRRRLLLLPQLWSLCRSLVSANILVVCRCRGSEQLREVFPFQVPTYFWRPSVVQLPHTKLTSILFPQRKFRTARGQLTPRMCKLPHKLEALNQDLALAGLEYEHATFRGQNAVAAWLAPSLATCCRSGVANWAHWIAWRTTQVSDRGLLVYPNSKINNSVGPAPCSLDRFSIGHTFCFPRIIEYGRNGTADCFGATALFSHQ